MTTRTIEPSLERAAAGSKSPDISRIERARPSIRLHQEVPG